MNTNRLNELNTKLKDFDSDLNGVIEQLNDGWDQLQGLWKNVQRFLAGLAGATKFTDDERDVLCIILQQRIETTQARNDADPGEVPNDVSDLVKTLTTIQTKLNCN